MLRPQFNFTAFQSWIVGLKWNPEAIAQWQDFYNDAPRWMHYGQSGNLTFEALPHLPAFEDLKPPPCKRGIPSSAIYQSSFILFILFSFLTTILLK